MSVEVVVPSLGESVSEATIAKWYKKAGDHVEVDELLLELETEKVTLEINATSSGILDSISCQENDAVSVGQVVGVIRPMSKEESAEKQDKKNDTQDQNQTSIKKEEAPAVNKESTVNKLSLIHICPTHDDITAESVAKAFNLKYAINQEIYYLLRDFYLQKGQEFNEARIKMSRMPEGAKLLRSSETLAPGFNIKNVFVMAGIPKIMKTMLTSAIALLPECELMKSKSLDVNIVEGVLAKDFGELQKKYKNVEMGSYPFSGNDKIGTSLVLRSFDDKALELSLIHIYL